MVASTFFLGGSNQHEHNRSSTEATTLQGGIGHSRVTCQEVAAAFDMQFRSLTEPLMVRYRTNSEADIGSAFGLGIFVNKDHELVAENPAEFPDSGIPHALASVRVGVRQREAVKAALS